MWLEKALRTCLRPVIAPIRSAVDRRVAAQVDARLEELAVTRVPESTDMQELEPPPPELPLVRPVVPRLYAYLSPDVALTQLYDGHFIYVDPADEEMGSQLIANGFWEMWTDQFVRRIVRPGDRVIDVGANHGYYTLIMASLIGDTGRLDSFEANPRIARLLTRSVWFNGYAPRVTIHAAAAGNKSGTVQFAAWRHQSGSGHLLVNDHSYAEDTMKLTVPMVCLDDVIGDEPVDVIRIDAEGAEPLILEGARQILRRSPTILICMEWGVGMMSDRKDVGLFISELRELGFGFWKIEHDSSLTELTDDVLKGVELCNIVVARDYPIR
jgi:FkbM family methyltransferase